MVWRILLSACCLSLFGACGTSSAHNDGAADAPLDVVSVDASDVMDVPTADCSATALACGSQCVNAATDPNNCGACGHACGAGNVCVGSTCVACAPLMACPGNRCVDTTSDAANCGSCGNACPNGQRCVASVCTCASPSQMCGAACVDTTTDANNCGSCGHPCATGLVCRMSACASACPDDLSGIGTGDFHISFSIATTQTTLVAVLNQRSVCDYSNFWDVRMLADGTIQIETCDAALGDYVTRSTRAVNDGAVHLVSIVRSTSNVIAISVDGSLAGVGPCSTSFGTLVPLVMRSDVCIGVDTTALVGTLTGVCVASP